MGRDNRTVLESKWASGIEPLLRSSWRSNHNEERSRQLVVIFSAAHALLITFLVRLRVAMFPAQVRIAYFVWVAVGTYVPGMVFLMYISTFGLATNLFVNYCPLARMLYLLPWNREEPFSPGLVIRVFLSPPVTGKFKPQPSI